MAMMGTGSGSGRRFGRNRYAPTSEINVTPFVDVMLVLLIIFMVAAPLLTVTVPVDLPKAGEATQKPEAKPLTVTVTGDGRVYLQDDEVAMDSLVSLIQQAAEGGTDQRVYVRGDRTVNYERVMKVMNLINSAGFTRIGLMGSVSQTLQAPQAQ